MPQGFFSSANSLTLLNIIELWLLNSKKKKYSRPVFLYGLGSKRTWVRTHLYIHHLTTNCNYCLFYQLFNSCIRFSVSNCPLTSLTIFFFYRKAHLIIANLNKTVSELSCQILSWELIPWLIFSRRTWLIFYVNETHIMSTKTDFNYG